LRLRSHEVLCTKGLTNMALENDTQAPDFELPNQFGEHIRLSDYRGKKPVALVFYPLAFSSTCTSELCELRDNLTLFQQSGIELIGISVDSKATLRAFAEAEGYDFTLLADFWPHGDVAKDYGVFIEEKGFANRATFLIDVNGIIRASFITAPGEARSLAEYKAAVAELVPVTA
jgi:mycoredoxin-dependent peroxiredoxin